MGDAEGWNCAQSSRAASVSSLQSFARGAASGCRLQQRLVLGHGFPMKYVPFSGEMDAGKGGFVVSERLKQKGMKPWEVHSL